MELPRNTYNYISCTSLPALSITPAKLAHSIFIPSLFHHAIQCQIYWSENTSTETVFTLGLLIAYQEKMQLLLISVGFLSPLDRCIIRVMPKKTPRYKNQKHFSGFLQTVQWILLSSFIPTALLYTRGSE